MLETMITDAIEHINSHLTFHCDKANAIGAFMCRPILTREEYPHREREPLLNLQWHMHEVFVACLPIVGGFHIEGCRIYIE
jgi:hypothetical protein